MNSPFLLGEETRNAFEISFQFDPGLYADQSQLNELEIDFDAFDEVGHQNDPFATPAPRPNLTIEDLTPRPVNVELSQSTLPPNISETPIHAEPSNTSHTIVPLPPASKRPVSDDFFDVRKRNSGIRAGLDLTAKSTARLWKAKDKKITPEEFEAIVQSKLSLPAPSVESTPTVTPMIPNLHVVENPVPPESKPSSSSKRFEVLKDAGVMKRKALKPKSILKYTKSNDPSASTQTTKHTTRASGNTTKAIEEKTVSEQKERRQSSGSIASIGGGLIDALVSYGEKIKNSLGLSSNTAPEELIAPDNIEEPLMENKPTDSSNMQTDPGSPPSDMDRIGGSHNKETISAILNDNASPPVRTSQKRLLPFSPGRERKRKCLQDENANVSAPGYHPTSGENILLADKMYEKEIISKESISRPKPLRPSRNINKAAEFTHSGQEDKLSSRPKSRSNAGRNSMMSTSRRIASTRGLNNSVSKVDSQPMFASDVYRQLALEKAQKEQLEKQRAHFVKPVPPARPTLRPTIPAAFVFHSEERIAQRHAVSEKGQKVETVQGPSAPHILPNPDSASTSTAATERKTRPNPFLSMNAPALNTMIRAKAREKFDNERKQREKILELQRLIRERERAEQEEKEYRDARKRTIPRAHEVPEWYNDAPHIQNKQKAAE